MSEQPNDDGGPAYPTGEYDDTCGMSLRDYFAGELIAVTFMLHMDDKLAAASTAYDLADALLSSRKAGR